MGVRGTQTTLQSTASHHAGMKSHYPACYAPVLQYFGVVCVPFDGFRTKFFPQKCARIRSCGQRAADPVDTTEHGVSSCRYSGALSLVMCALACVLVLVCDKFGVIWSISFASSVNLYAHRRCCCAGPKETIEHCRNSLHIFPLVVHSFMCVLVRSAAFRLRHFLQV